MAQGKTTAIVGASGSGKSTVVKLLERYYDPMEGSIDVQSQPLKDLNLMSY
ncbi:MAG: ATP-binding cassette domain-containing protein [Streptococcus sp.]|nr:ATP-binding cassette domain-containing protein [Streptococcus sp.]